MAKLYKAMGQCYHQLELPQRAMLLFKKQLQLSW